MDSSFLKPHCVHASLDLGPTFTALAFRVTRPRRRGATWRPALNSTSKPHEQWHNKGDQQNHIRRPQIYPPLNTAGAFRNLPAALFQPGVDETSRTSGRSTTYRALRERPHTIFSARMDDHQSIIFALYRQRFPAGKNIFHDRPYISHRPVRIEDNLTPDGSTSNGGENYSGCQMNTDSPESTFLDFREAEESQERTNENDRRPSEHQRPLPPQLNRPVLPVSNKETSSSTSCGVHGQYPAFIVLLAGAAKLIPVRKAFWTQALAVGPTSVRRAWLDLPTAWAGPLLVILGDLNQPP